MTKKETIEKLKELGYAPFDREHGDIYVYDKNIHYITTLNVKNGKLTWNDRDCTKVAISDLMDLVAEYNKTLEFPPETYSPDCNNEYATEVRINATLENCGFVYSGKRDWGNNCIYNADGPLGAKYTTIHDGMMLLGDDKYIQLYEDDASDSEKCNAIKSMVNAFYVANIAELCNRLDKMGDIREKLTSIPIQTLDYKTGQTATTEGVDGIIALLENTLKRLKKD